MVTFRPLSAADFDAIHAAFNEAFSDYFVPLTLTREQLAEMLRRRGWAPERSVAAFENERMVAFTLNGIDGDRAYDTGTGVIPSDRRRGLGRLTMEHSFDLLRDCATYTLEVLEANERAAALYRSLGFRETRGLQCWRYESQRRKVSKSQRIDAPTPLRHCDSETLRLWWSVLPAWQNSTASIGRAAEEHMTIGDDDGYAIVFPGNGDLAQLAVRPESRRRGTGTRLLEEAAALAGKPLRIMNVEDSDAGIASFLERAGATRTVRQVEMVRTLSAVRYDPLT